jgi:hypothetical protein
VQEEANDTEGLISQILIKIKSYVEQLEALLGELARLWAKLIVQQPLGAPLLS